MRVFNLHNYPDFSFKSYKVNLVDRKTASAFICKHHYSQSCPNVVLYYGLFLNGDSSNTNVASLPITVNSDGTYTANSITTALESKTSIFDTLDQIINALRQQDSSGNAITEDAANQILSNSLEKIGSANDNVNLNHAILGTRTSYIDNYEQITEAKITNFNIPYETYPGAEATRS